MEENPMKNANKFKITDQDLEVFLFFNHSVFKK